MILQKYMFTKKCSFNMCQNSADYKFNTNRGDVLICKDCLNALKKELKIKQGENDGAGK